MIFAKNIQNLLKIHNSTREEVDKFLGVKYTTFCDWAKGRTYPKMEYIIEIADYFNVKTYALTDENPNYEKAYAEAFEENFNAPKELPIYKYNEKNITRIWNPSRGDKDGAAGEETAADA
mgnify:CR=1 FL=1